MICNHDYPCVFHIYKNSCVCCSCHIGGSGGSLAVWHWAGSSVCVRLDATEAPAGSRGARARGASTNELHSFPHFSIWWPIVLGHRGRSDAICWHVLSFSQTVQPTEGLTGRRQARAACCFTRHTQHAYCLCVSVLMLIQSWWQHSITQ